jgi:hypothetical protein
MRQFMWCGVVMMMDFVDLNPHFKCLWVGTRLYGFEFPTTTTSVLLGGNYLYLLLQVIFGTSFRQYSSSFIYLF